MIPTLRSQVCAGGRGYLGSKLARSNATLTVGGTESRDGLVQGGYHTHMAAEHGQRGSPDQNVRD